MKKFDKKAYMKIYNEQHKQEIKEKGKIYRDQNKEKYIKWAIEHPEKLMLNRAKHNAKSQNLPFNLECDDIIVPDKCPVFGTPMKYENGSRRKSPSLDKIIPSAGYVKENVQVISWLANKMKSDATIDELLLFADWVYKTYGQHRKNAAQ